MKQSSRTTTDTNQHPSVCLPRTTTNDKINTMHTRNFLGYCFLLCYHGAVKSSKRKRWKRQKQSSHRSYDIPCYRKTNIQKTATKRSLSRAFRSSVAVQSMKRKVKQYPTPHPPKRTRRNKECVQVYTSSTAALGRRD